MTYFSVRKHHPEPEPEPIEEDLPEDEEADEEPEPEQRPASRPGPLSGLRRWLAWCSALIGTGPTYTLHAVALWAVPFYGGWIALTVTAGFALAVGAFTPREHLDRLTAWIERRDTRAQPPGDDEPEAGEEQPAEAFVDPLPGILWELIGQAPGVHLKSVVTHLHETGLDAACDKAAVKAALDRRGIPTRGSVREADGRVNEGVHRADLKGWQDAHSPTAPAGCPKTRSEPVATALTSDVATEATAVATPPTAP